MTKRPPLTPTSIEANFDLIVAAALAGERCPQKQPHGPLRTGAFAALVESGRIRSEVYALNFCRVVILTGEHKGKSTASPPGDGPPYRINGRYVGATLSEQRNNRRKP